MTDLLRDVEAPSDAELISRVRGGDLAAYGELFARHKDAANRLARQLVRGPDSDDLVSEAFAKVLTVLQGGGGPDVAFRAYLLTAVRRLHIDRVRLGQRLQTTGDMTPFDPGVPFKDTAVAGFESGAAAKAFASLPERWQLVLWHLEVEGQKPADIAPLLGMSANSVSALAYRAREGLRQAFLTMHLSDISDTECRWVTDHLGAFVRKGLSKRDTSKVRTHLADCRRCTAMYLELDEVNSDLAGIIAPLLLGAAATGYVVSTGGAGSAGVLGALSALSKAKEVVVANTTAAGMAAAGVAATAAAAVVVAATVHHGAAGHRPEVAADPSVAVTTSAPALPGGSGSPTSVPTSAATPTLAPSATASVSPSLTASLTASPTASPSGSPSAPLVAPVIPSFTPSLSSSASPSESPSQPVNEPVADTAPVVGEPVLHADGTVTLTVQGMQVTDTLGVAIDSTATTFADALGVPDCQVLDARHVTCHPLPSQVREDAGLDGTAAGSGYSVTLPLTFPAYMVSDDVRVTATVDQASSSVRDSVYRPGRTPTFDFSAPVLDDSPAHTVLGDTDRYDVTTTAALPPGVTGLVYTVSGPVRFRPVDGGDCTVVDDRTLRCAHVRDGDRVHLLLAATSLVVPADVEVTASPVDDFVDPTPGDTTSPPIRLAPGADLGLDLGVLSADPARTALVTLSGRLSGVRAGSGEVVYTVSSGASFPGGNANPGCRPDGASLTCPTPVNGALTLVVRADAPTDPTPVTVSVAPTRPFVVAGSGPHSAEVLLPGGRVHDFSFTGLTETAHTVDGDTDRHTLTGTVGVLPPDGGPVAFELTGGGRFADVQGGGCDLSASPQTGGQVVCTGLSGGDPVSLVVESSTHAASRATVVLRPDDSYGDPDLADNAQSVALRPGTPLALTPQALGALHQNAYGNYAVSVRLSGLRAGVDGVALTLEPGGLAFVRSGTDGCDVVGDRLVCSGPASQAELDFTVGSDTPARPHDLTVLADPVGDFVTVGTDNEASGSLVPAADFAMGDLTTTRHTVSGDTDTYVLHSAVRALPPGLDSLTFEVTGGDGFAADQVAGCTTEDRTHVRCDGLADGRDVTFRVDSTSTVQHDARLRLIVPTGYDDMDLSDNSSAVAGLRPGVDLHLASLDPDNESPSNDDDRHVVGTRLTGVRAGLDAVTYTLQGDATFSSVASARCGDVSGKSITCTGPTDGPVVFTITSDDVRSATPIRIAVQPVSPFVELDETDNSDAASLAPRPTYDFGLGDLSVSTHSVTGDTDHFTVTGTVRAVPDGVDSLTFALSGGTLSSQQGAGCDRVDDTHARCTDLAVARPVDLRVDSTVATAHDIGLALELPRRYDDPDTADNAARVAVTPGVDLTMGPLTPADPVPTGDAYRVTSVLTGVRSGPVTFTVSGGATFTDASSCPRTTPTTLTCAEPTTGQRVAFTLTPDRPAGGVTASIRAAAAAPLVELDDSDNAATTALAPDVVLDSVVVTGHRALDLQAVVRARVSGLPTGVGTVRLRLSGTRVGTGLTQVHLTDGASGADGEGGVACATTDADGRVVLNGVYATCTNVRSITGGRFFVDMRVARPPGSSSSVTFTVLPVGVDEGSHSRTNNARDLTVS